MPSVWRAFPYTWSIPLMKQAMRTLLCFPNDTVGTLELSPLLTPEIFPNYCNNSVPHSFQDGPGSVIPWLRVTGKHNVNLTSEPKQQDTVPISVASQKIIHPEPTGKKFLSLHLVCFTQHSDFYGAAVGALAWLSADPKEKELLNCASASSLCVCSKQGSPGQFRALVPDHY